MNPTSLVVLLHLLTSLLLGAQTQLKTTATTPAALAPVVRTVTVANQAFQLAAQAHAMESEIGFPIPKNTSIWPNIVDLVPAAYLDANGKYAQVGTDVSLDEGSVSYGDLNADGLDDAALMVERVANNKAPTFALAAMLNQGNIMFNIADIDLGQTVIIYSHHIENGLIILDMKIDDQPRATYTYQLIGNALQLVSKE